MQLEFSTEFAWKLVYSTKKNTVSFLIATTVLECVFLFDDLGSDVCVCESLSAGLNPDECTPRQGQHLQTP